MVLLVYKHLGSKKVLVKQDVGPKTSVQIWSVTAEIFLIWRNIARTNVAWINVAMTVGI